LPGRRYRSKLELLRDFLAAAQTETVKTRIMNRANLNQASFSRYTAFCQERQLLLKVNGGYVLTPRADDLLQSLDQVLTKMAALRAAMDLVNRTARSGGYRLPPPEIALRPRERDGLPEILSRLPSEDRRPQIPPQE
jgi:predicted transcriptional regulator